MVTPRHMNDNTNVADVQAGNYEGADLDSIALVCYEKNPLNLGVGTVKGSPCIYSNCPTEWGNT